MTGSFIAAEKKNNVVWKLLCERFKKDVHASSIAALGTGFFKLFPIFVIFVFLIICPAFLPGIITHHAKDLAACFLQLYLDLLCLAVTHIAIADDDDAPIAVGGHHGRINNDLQRRCVNEDIASVVVPCAFMVAGTGERIIKPLSTAVLNTARVVDNAFA